MIRQSEFKRKYNPEMGKYEKQHIYGEGIMDTVKSFFKKPTPKKPPPKPTVQKKVTFDPSTIVKEKKAGDKIVKLLSREKPPQTTKTKRKMSEKEYNQYLENLRKLYNY